MRPKGKVGAVLLMTVTLLLLMASPALATVRITIDCDAVTVDFFEFPEGEHSATVDINGEVHQVSWTGAGEVFTFPIDVGFEGGTWTVHAEWEVFGPKEATVTRTFAEGECAASPSPSPTPTPTPTETTPAPAETSPPPEEGEAKVKGKKVKEKPAEGQAAAAEATSLPFTGPRDAVPVLSAIAASLFVVGLLLVWSTRYRGAHRPS
jgi:hypothetical protein